LLKGPRRLFDAAKNISLQDKSMAIYFGERQKETHLAKYQRLKWTKAIIKAMIPR
jgi:hypothetical protein